MKEIYCPKCGNQLPVTVHFCSKCGSRINYAHRNEHANDCAERKNKDKGKIVMLETYKAEFTKLNLLNFLQEQKFFQSDGKTEAAFLELMWRRTNSCLLSNNDPFESYFKSELERLANAGSCKFNLQNVPEKTLAKMIRRHRYGSFFNRLFHKLNYDIIFVAEFTYLLQLFEKPLSEEKEIELCTLLEMDKQIFHSVVCQVRYPFERIMCHECKAVEDGGKMSQNEDSFAMKDFGASPIDILGDFRFFSRLHRKYDSLGIINIGICATMSAGKSTLVNALLGHDFLPARNEATTACITSVYDNDYLGGKDSPAICTYEKDKDTYTRNITAETLDEWNGDQNTNRIVIQADLENIASSNAIVAVHDTPGTNNSGDNSHHDTTINFIKENKLDAIIFVVNAEQLSTTDEKILLSEIKKHKAQNTQVIFVVNKADRIDEEKESLADMLSVYKNYLGDLGFDNPHVFPVSAKAARLFKMALKGKADRFSEDEIDDFYTSFKKFSKKIDFSNGESSTENAPIGKIQIEDKEFDLAELSHVLKRTGISALENAISKLINNSMTNDIITARKKRLIKGWKI